jgi:hypothetical protein
VHDLRYDNWLFLMSTTRRHMPLPMAFAAAAVTPTGGNWRYVAGHFRDFVSSLEPQAAERSTAVATASAVDLLLRRRFPMARGVGATLEPPPVIIGGYAKDTAVGGISGVDLVFVLPDRYRTEPAELAGTGQNVWSAVLRDMTSLLAARFAAVEMSRDGWLSVTAHTPEHDPLGVRIIPGFLCGANGYLVPANAASTPGKPWRHMIPKAEKNRLDRVDDDTAQKARHLIRMLKVWRYAASIPVTSFALELLVCEFLSIWTYRQRSALFYDWMVRDFFFWMATQSGRSLGIAGSGETLTLSDLWLDRVLAARDMAAEAANMERDNQSVAAIACWRRIFGCRFGEPAQGRAMLFDGLIGDDRRKRGVRGRPSKTA